MAIAVDDRLSAKSLLQTIKERRSVREYSTKTPTLEEVNQMLEAASFAPSGTNYQPWRFLVIFNNVLKTSMAEVVEDKAAAFFQDSEGIDEFADKYRQYFCFFKDAPLVIAATYKPYPSIKSMSWGDQDFLVSTAIQSLSAAMQNLLLMAHTLGYGGCWMGNPLIAGKELEEILDVFPPWRLLALIPIGEPLRKSGAPKRKKIELISKVIPA